jgi:hypothetical protein
MTRSIIRPTTPAEAASRARSMIGFKVPLHANAPAGIVPMRIAYRIDGGNGGTDPLAPHCASWSYGWRVPTSDCVGLACWAIGTSRFHKEFTEYGGDMNTDSMILDADGKRSFYTDADRPRVGGLCVTPSIFTKGRPRRPGHVGVIVKVPTEWDPKAPQWDLVHVVHCHGPQSAVHMPAISLGDAWLWMRKPKSRLLYYVRAA